MAQLNYYTYLSQCTWLIIIFFIYYYNLKQKIFPGLVEKIKVTNFFKDLNTQTKVLNNTKTSKSHGKYFLFF